jgi:hypothetical protein
MDAACAFLDTFDNTQNFIQPGGFLPEEAGFITSSRSRHENRV